MSIDDVPEAARQKVSTALGVTLPDNFGQVTIMSKDKLSQWQSIVNGIDRVIALNGLVLVGMGAIATHAAHTGIGAFLPALVALALVGPIGNAMIARFIEGRGG